MVLGGDLLEAAVDGSGIREDLGAIGEEDFVPDYNEKHYRSRKVSRGYRGYEDK